MSKETLISIAQRTGFSVSTVSRVLSGQAAKYRISEKTVALIAREAERCNYTPSLLAKGLRTSRTDTLGLLIPSIDNPYFAHIASIIVHEARAKGYKVILIDTSEDERNEREGVRSLLSRQGRRHPDRPGGRRPRLSGSDRAPDARRLHRPPLREDVAALRGDRQPAGRPRGDAAPHRPRPPADPLHPGRAPLDPVGRPRAGLPAGARRQRAERLRPRHGDGFSIRNGYEQTLRALHVRQRPTAIFALSNTILLGALKAVREMKLRIPDDISLVSFDNYDYLDYLDPAVTRVGQPSDEIGAQAMEILLQRIAGETGGEEQRRLPPSLIVCRSVRKL